VEANWHAAGAEASDREGRAFEIVSVVRGKAVMVVPESTGKP
jgi:hypothetical protein